MNITYKGKVRNSEVDSQGIVHHAKYLEWMECARIKHFDLIGGNLYALGNLGIDLVVTSININYFKVICADDAYEVESIIGIKKPVKYTFINRVYSRNVLCAEANIVGCAIDRKTKKINRKIITNLFEKHIA